MARRKLGRAPEGSSVLHFEKVRGDSTYRSKENPDLVISRGELERVRAIELGYESRSDRQKETQSDEFKRWLQEAKATGMDRAQLELYYTASRNSNWDTAYDGPFAEMLEALGMRTPFADYNVGESPKR